MELEKSVLYLFKNATLVYVRAPPVLFHFYHRLRKDNVRMPEELDFLESFCGAQALCKGFRKFHWDAIGLDLEHHEIFQNVMSPEGLLNYVAHTQKLHPFTQHASLIARNSSQEPFPRIYRAPEVRVLAQFLAP